MNSVRDPIRDPIEVSIRDPIQFCIRVSMNVSCCSIQFCIRVSMNDFS